VRASRHRDDGVPAGPELLSLAVLVLAALLVAAASSYSWVNRRSRPADDVAPPGRDGSGALPDRGALRR
jgi:hypothetical protein